MRGERTLSILAQESHLRQHPEDAQSLFALGDLYRQLALYPHAARCYQLARGFEDRTGPQSDPKIRPTTYREGIPTFNPFGDSKIRAADSGQPDWIRTRLAQPAGEAARVCTRCLSVTTSPASLQWDAEDLLCPACIQRERERSMERGAIFSLLLIGLALGTGFFLDNLALIYGFLNLTLFFVLLYPLLLIHETAHLACALLLGGRVYRLELGSGKLAFERTIAGVRVSLRWIPSTGATRFAFPPSGTLRLRHGITLLAGPLINLIFLFSVIADFQGNRILSGFALPEMFLLANLFLLLGSLLPARDRPSSDSLQLLRTLLVPETGRTLAANYFLLEAHRMLELDRLQVAHRICRTGLEGAPDHLPLNLLCGKLLLELERPQAALDHFNDLLQQELRTPEALASIQSGIAMACLQMQDPHASDHAQRALLTAPWLPASRQAWGQALLAGKECPAAAYHLLLAAGRHRSHRDRASCIAHAALAALGMDQREQAQALALRAHRLDPKPPAVSAAVEQISP